MKTAEEIYKLSVDRKHSRFERCLMALAAQIEEAAYNDQFKMNYYFAELQAEQALQIEDTCKRLGYVIKFKKVHECTKVTISWTKE